MCGITIYGGPKIPISDIWKSMLEIKHRGDEDGKRILSQKQEAH